MGATSSEILYKISAAAASGHYWSSWLRWLSHFDTYATFVSHRYKQLRQYYQHSRKTYPAIHQALKVIDFFGSHFFSRSCSMLQETLNLALTCSILYATDNHCTPSTLLKYGVKVFDVTYKFYWKVRDNRTYRAEAKELLLLEQLGRTHPQAIPLSSRQTTLLSASLPVLAGLGPSTVLNSCLAAYLGNWKNVLMTQINFMIAFPAYTLLTYQHASEYETKRQQLQQAAGITLSGEALLEYHIKQQAKQRHKSKAFVARQLLERYPPPAPAEQVWHVVQECYQATKDLTACFTPNPPSREDLWQEIFTQQRSQLEALCHKR
jgi:hypothetical protein